MPKVGGQPFAAVIMAAGKGTRMKSDLAKVLHRLGDKPLIQWVIGTAREAGAERIVVVVGHQREDVRAALGAGIETVVQDPQLGTGHAVKCAEPALKDYAGPVAVLSGDVPLLRAETLGELAVQRAQGGAAVAVLTAQVNGPHAYGRMVRNGAGDVERIVENKDASDEEKRINEINTGTYVFAPGALFGYLQRLRDDNAQGEFYLTDTVGLAVGDGKRVIGVKAPVVEECLGINTPEELAAAEKRLALRGGA